MPVVAGGNRPAEGRWDGAAIPRRINTLMLVGGRLHQRPAARFTVLLSILFLQQFFATVYKLLLHLAGETATREAKGALIR